MKSIEPVPEDCPTPVVDEERGPAPERVFFLCNSTKIFLGGKFYVLPSKKVEKLVRVVVRANEGPIFMGTPG